MLAIVWTNRGNAGTDTDMFNATYGAMAQVARQNIDRAIENWNEVILDYNFDGDNNPATNNVFTLTVMAADLGGGLRGQGAPTNVDGNGLPTSGNLTMDDAGGSGGWFIDPTPFADDEFLFPVTQFEANSTQSGNDFFRTAVHEIGHTVGILTGFGVALNNFLTPAGTDQVSGTDNLNIFQNVAGQFGVSVTITDNGGGHVYEGPVDPAFPGAPINPNDLMNPGRTVGPPATRQMVTDLNAMILADAYGYKVQLPSATAFTFIAQDQLEDNNTLQTAFILGSLPKVTINDVSIFDTGDEDFYRYTAPLSGKLDVRAFFNHAVGNDINIQVLGANGADITPAGQGDSTTDNEQIIVPVVAGQTYFIRVFGTDGSIQNYDLEVENFAAPAPAFVDLLASSDTGMMNNDDITSDTTPTFLIQADLAEFLNTGITLLNQPVIDPDNNGIATDANDDGAGVYLSLIHIATGALVEGFANQVGATGILWSFTVPAISALAAGDWFVSSAVQIVDPQDTNPAAGTQRATGRAQLSDPLIITIIPEGAVVNASLDLVTSSDTGMSNIDNVTNKMSPAFVGVAPVGFKVRLYASGSLVGQTVAGSDTSDVGVGGVGGLGGANNDGFGIWEITTEPLADGAYDITLELEDAAGNVTIVNPSLNAGTTTDIWVDTIDPNTPFLDILATFDTGRSNVDDITTTNRPTVVMRGNDTTNGGPTNPFPNDVKFRLYLRPDGAIPTSEILVYDSFTALGGFTTLSSITQTISLALNNPAGAVIPDGVHNFKLEIEDRAGNISHDFLLPFEVDTVVPPVSFGDPAVANDGLKAGSDSGVGTVPVTLNDRITNDTTPTLWGLAEANSIVRVFADVNGDGAIDPGDLLLGLTVALPYDGNLAFADGYWELTTSIDMNDPAFFPVRDGLRRLLVTAEDVAGNVNLPNDLVGDAQQALQIFIDTQGPQVNDVFITGQRQYDLFDPKPSVDGPTPLVNQLTIEFTDNPNRLIPGFDYPGLVEGIAEAPGNYRLVGDHVGIIPIQTITFVPGMNVNGQPAVDSVILTFTAPLPDDRFTLTILDNLVDPVGNNLDGESNGVEPLDNPLFPSGDGVPGGNFQARFTVDTRPEIGSFVAQSISIDINGNFVWDPANGQIGNDATNVDLSFTLPVAAPGGVIGLGGYNVHDLLFAGRFSLNDTGGSDGFDTLAAFGNSAELGVFRWLVDRNHDGVVSPALGDILTTQPLLPNFNVPGAIPVAGNFVGGGLSDDEIGLYNQGKWAFDTNKNFIIEAGEVFTNGMLGHPIVGDFDGDGLDDLAVFNNNQIFFNFANDGLTDAADQVVVWGYPGVLDRPVAADMDRDGIDDIGLFVPRNSSATPPRQSEWYFLISDDHASTKRVTGSAVTLNHPFTTVPFGKDLYAEFGDDLALPIVGNFDPPVAAQSVNPQGGMDGDYDGDGDVDGRDFLAWQRSYGSTVNLAADGDHNNVVDSGDLAMWSGAYTNSSSAAMTTDYDGDADVDGHDFLMLQRSGANSAAVISWQAEFGNSGSASLLASLSVVENDPPTTSLSSVSEAAPAAQSSVSSPALFWLSLPEQSTAYAQRDYLTGLAEPQVEQSRAENWSTFGAALTISHTEEYQFSVDEEESDADFELVLDEAFSELGL